MVNHIFIYLKYELRDFKLNYINQKRSRFGGLNPKLVFNVQMTTFKENKNGIYRKVLRQSSEHKEGTLFRLYWLPATGTVYFHVPQRRN